MQGSNYSYLDLSVMSFLRRKVISDDAVILFNHEFSKVLWANAVSTRLFGNSGIGELLEIELSPTHSLISQLIKATQQLDTGESIIRNFKISHGLKSDHIQGEIMQIDLPNGDAAILLTFAREADDKPRREHELAQLTVNSLDGFADAAAILDEYGLILASSGDFNKMDVDPETLESLVGFVSSEDDRLVKRQIQRGDGKLVAAGLGKIRDIPGRYIIVLAEARDFVEEEAQVEENLDVSSPDLDELDNDSNSQVDDNLDVLFIPQTPMEAQENSADIPSQIEENESTSPSISDKHDESHPRDERNSDIATHITTEPNVVESQEPLRFAFKIDENQIIRSVSPELENAVGSASADIVDKSWQDLTTLLNIDPNHEILKLLERADTWSGKSVLWPVTGTDMVIPIDLAALPIFDRDRNFEGHRGFGVIRDEDTIVDPDGLGNKLTDRLEEFKSETIERSGTVKAGITSNSNHEDFLSEERKSVIENQETKKYKFDQDNDDEIDRYRIRSIDENLENQHIHDNILDEIEDQNPDTSSNDTRSSDSNIVNLSNRRERSGSLLSTSEEDAFSEIEKTLSGTLDEPKFKDHDSITNLPYPVVVYRENETLYANGALLEITGYASLEEISQAGGVDALLSFTDLQPDKKHHNISIIHKNGTESPIKPILKTIQWNEEKALCLTFDNVAVTGAISKKFDNKDKSPLDLTRISELENILDTIADGIVIINSNGEIESLNSSGEALFGKQNGEVSGKPFASLFIHESRNLIEGYLLDQRTPSMSGILNNGVEAIGLEAKGGLIPLFVTIGSIGSASRHCAVLRDVTSWKKSEEELIQSKRSAEDANDQKTEFLARVSHEIREPLNAVIGFSDVMIEERFGPIDNERYREYLIDINRSGIHVLDLVNDLLDISKIEAGKLELGFESVELNQLVAETIALLQPQANDERIIIRTSLSRAVPKVVADPRTVRQIILNLVSNAIHHSPTNSQVIVSTTYEENGEVGLRIRDTGLGMDTTQLKSALEPFSQVKGATKSTRKGTGLGLPLAKALVEANRAYFDLESKPGEGTVAHILFPKQRVLDD